MREVCDSGWGIEDAQVVCHQLGFSPQGISCSLSLMYPILISNMISLGTSYCTRSCFGASVGVRGFTKVGCTGEENRIIDCPGEKINGLSNCHNAGVICSKLPVYLFRHVVNHTLYH